VTAENRNGRRAFTGSPRDLDQLEKLINTAPADVVAKLREIVSK
jgi:hypothetical protein